MAFTPVADADIRALVDIPATSSTETYCAAANLLVTEKLVPSSAGMSDARLTLIAQFLGAHFAVVGEEFGGLTSSQADGSRGAKDTYSINKMLGAGISSTRWGQQAIAFDDSGLLQGVSTGKPKAQIQVFKQRRRNGWGGLGAWGFW